MKSSKIESFNVIGIYVRTINDEDTAKAIGGLWGKFMGENITAQIPNKIEESIYSVYTNYEGDHTEPYTTILGCKVSSLDDVPEGMIGKRFEGGNCVQFVSKGDLTQGAVYKTWNEIWQTPLDRNYVFDFEVYGEKAMNPNDAEVDIFIGVI